MNLPLAVWALIKQPRNPAYRVFALFAISLAIWNLGGEVFHHGGAESIWKRLSFFGMALAPANFLCLALVARGRAGSGLSSPRGGYWHLLLYAPMVALGLALNPAVIAQKALSHSWLSGFYVMSAPDTLVFAAVTAGYLAAALWISWRAGRRAAQGEDWPFYMVQLPFAAGHALRARGRVSPLRKIPDRLALGHGHVAVRHVPDDPPRLVGFELSLKRGVTLAFLAVVLAACVLLGLTLISVLFGRTFSLEKSLILVVCAVALCVLYAALVPRLEEFFDAIFHRNRNH